MIDHAPKEIPFKLDAKRGDIADKSVAYARAGLRVWCFLGDVREIAEVSLNGRPAGTSWTGPRQVEITGLTREGDNDLEIKVTNLLINRVLGQPEPEVGGLVAKYGFLFPGGDVKPAQNDEKAKVKEPLPSGLLGPVEVRAEQSGG